MVSSAAPTPLVPYFLSVPQLGNFGCPVLGRQPDPQGLGAKARPPDTPLSPPPPPPSFVEEGGVVSRMVSDKMKRNLPVAE